MPTRFLNVLVATLGSYGDVLPLAAIATTLKQRGHTVTFITGEYFEPLIQRLGLEFIALGSRADYEAVVRHPDLWHPRRALGLIARVAMIPHLRPFLDLAAAKQVPGRTVIVASTLTIGARLAQEKLGIPVVSVHLQPVIFRSVEQPPNVGLPLMARWMPRRLKRWMWWLADTLLIDPILARPLNEVRRELGLPPVRRVLDQWLHSPLRVLGLFPEWFAPPQMDWPSQTRLTGFPLMDAKASHPLSADLARFLDEGEPPVVATPGSAMFQGKRFFAEVVAALKNTGRRGVLLTKEPGQLPANLPPSIRHVDYAPLSELLPRATAMIHHGGIGTSAQVLAAGLPHLLMPMAHDQHDNADRLKAFGVADVLRPRHFTARSVGEKLNRLLDDWRVKSQCRILAERMVSSEVAVNHACNWIETAVEE